MTDYGFADARAGGLWQEDGRGSTVVPRVALDAGSNRERMNVGGDVATVRRPGTDLSFGILIGRLYSRGSLGHAAHLPPSAI